MEDHHASSTVIDLRTSEEYLQGHLGGAYSLPWDSMSDLSAALPPRDVSLVVITPTHEPPAAFLEVYFHKLGYKDVTLRAPTKVELTSQAVPLGFCWSPNFFFQKHLPSIPPSVALDVGSGAGRDLIFAASRGWQITGIENRVVLLKRCARMAAFYNVSHRVCLTCADVKKKLPLRPLSFDLIHVCRFIYRPMMPHLFALLRPGGVFIYSHFLEGCEKTAVGHPKKLSGFFRVGELESIFTESDFVILATETKLLDDGRPMIHVLAQKKK